MPEGGLGAVDRAAIAKAESVIAEMGENYLDCAGQELARIANAQEQLKAHRDDPMGYLKKVFLVAHDLKGQGGAFNYDLITILGGDLCRFIEGKKTLNTADIQVIDLYIHSMKNIISGRMSGDGGVEGEKILTGLDAVVSKISS